MELAKNVYNLPDKKTKEVPEIFKDLPAINKNSYIKIRYKPIGIRDKNKKIIKVTGYSLYLDIWENGKHTYYFPRVHLSGKKKYWKEDKFKLDALIKVRNKKEIEYDEKGIKLGSVEKKRKMEVLPCFKEMAMAADNKTTWINTYNHLEKFTPSNTIFAHITELYCEKFRRYLLDNVSQNSARLYFTILKSMLNKAVRQDYLSKNPAAYKDMNIKEIKAKKAWLTETEIKKLAETPIDDIDLRSAFLFSCFCGLRRSDIIALTFDDIQDAYIYFRQEKTEDVERLKLSSNALKIINQQRERHKGGLVFQMNGADSTQWLKLKQWAVDAEIKKKISFHTARHTFATLALSNDVDLYTVSKLLGHSEIRSTQVYAKLIDRKKDEAIDKLPEIDF